MRRCSGDDTPKATSLCDRRLGYHEQVGACSFLFDTPGKPLVPCLSQVISVIPDNVGGRRVSAANKQIDNRVSRNCRDTLPCPSPELLCPSPTGLSGLCGPQSPMMTARRQADGAWLCEHVWLTTVCLQGLQVSQRLDAASRGPCGSEVPQSGRRVRGPRAGRVRYTSKRGCNKGMQCGCSGLPNKRCRSDDSLVVVAGESRRSGLSARLAMVWFARCCSACGVTLAAVVPRPSAGRDMWPCRQNTKAQYRRGAHKANSCCVYGYSK